VIDIADYIYSHPTLLDLSLQGIWLGDRKFFVFYIFSPSERVYAALISLFPLQQQTPAVDFVHKYQHVFSLK
jgi:carboxypeptidase D